MSVGDVRMLLAGSIGALDGQVYGQAITSVGTTLGVNVIDTCDGVKYPQVADWGIGSSIHVEATILQSLTSDGAATVELGLIQADDRNLSVNVDSLGLTGEMPYSELTRGTQVAIAFNAIEPFRPRRYIGLQCIVRNAALTNTQGWLFVWAVLARSSRNNRELHSGFEIL